MGKNIVGYLRFTPTLLSSTFYLALVILVLTILDFDLIVQLKWLRRETNCKINLKNILKLSCTDLLGYRSMYMNVLNE